MHELGIAQSVLEAVEDELRNQPGSTLRKVGMRIGELAGVDPESLRFSWECLVRDTAYDGVTLDIERTDWRRRCPNCGVHFVVLNYQTSCSQCGCNETEHESGDELDVAYLELEAA